jgi:aspartyl-tRNA synthetase
VFLFLGRLQRDINTDLLHVHQTSTPTEGVLRSFRHNPKFLSCAMRPRSPAALARLPSLISRRARYAAATGNASYRSVPRGRSASPFAAPIRDGFPSSSASVSGPRALSTATTDPWATVMRTHSCAGVVDSSARGPNSPPVVLCGWVERFRPAGAALAFVRMRDRSGHVQLRLENPEHVALFKDMGTAAVEAVIQVSGVVVERPTKDIKADDPSGGIEIVAADVHFLNARDATPLPFDVSTPTEERPSALAERARLKHRYLDLRRPELQHNLALRSRFTHAVRCFLHSREFLDIETPTLFKRTVESGAKEFLVPTRQRGKFYALPQSPQQYKQLLMVAGFDRYFQIARCYRDEGQRADRQPEFTQVDLEMSFVEAEDVMAVVEQLLQSVFSEVLGVDLPRSFDRMSHEDAMNIYGADKPDRRFELLLNDASGALGGASSPVPLDIFRKSTLVKFIRVPGLVQNSRLSRGELKRLRKAAEDAHGQSVVIQLVPDGDSVTWSTQFEKQLTPDARAALLSATDAKSGDVLVFANGQESQRELNKVNSVLGRTRLELASVMRERGSMPPEDARVFDPLWVVDFPLFEFNEETGTMESSHHPFTNPRSEDVPLLSSANRDDLLRVRGYHYDIVLNGAEIGGGSIRIHDPAVQERVCELLDPSGSMLDQFEHLFEALRCGAPPHGGIALGLDRLISIVCGAHSLRDVIAFPKTGSGNELMTGAPSPVSPVALSEFGLTAVEENNTTSES